MKANRRCRLKFSSCCCIQLRPELTASVGLQSTFLTTLDVKLAIRVGRTSNVVGTTRLIPVLPSRTLSGIAPTPVQTYVLSYISGKI